MGVMKHGAAKRSGMTPEYFTWLSMKSRCLDPKSRGYEHYGGRGITISDRWLHSFANFIADMGPRPSREYSIERKDNDGNYGPENCVWATRVEQGRNKRNNVNITHQGLTLSVAEWSRRTGICAVTIQRRVRDGWETDRVLGQSVRRKATLPPAIEICCACGCGSALRDRDERGRSRRFITGHNNQRLSAWRERKEKG